MKSVDVGLLSLRVLVGAVFVGHGLIKFTQRLGGLGLPRASSIFEQLGYRPARPFVVAAGVVELFAGVAVLAGLATALAAAAIVGVMVNAIGASKAGHGPWYFNGGWEYDLTLGVTAAALAFTGPGTLSFDHALGLDSAGWAWGAGALALGIASGLAILVLRGRSAREAATRDAVA
jgi:putative oxidoreductase